MSLAGKKELKDAFEQTRSIHQEFSGSDDIFEVEMPLAEMFGVEHSALAEFVSERADEITHGLFQAMEKGLIPRDPVEVGWTVMAELVRGIAMGIVLERARATGKGERA